MKRALDPHIANLRSQLDASPWLVWALALIVLLALFFLAQGLETLRAKAQDNAIDAEVKLRQIQALQGQDVWMEREKESAELLANLRAEIPIVSTPGLAQASFQSWLNDLSASASGASNSRVNVDSAATVEGMPGLIRVSGTLSAGMPPRQALNIVRLIESSTNLVLIETLDIRNDANKILTVRVNAYYQLPAGEQAP
ncbi:hypothetical protein FQY83_14805 [Luteimonas marina]|uniref:Uncharacterized protein n=1 Tax=Luteimonas marina TaxID=488485 RepID=A0A5C5TWS8_9GAMM|nr:hypothetical protein [Luteimonas marina]TWT18643.1 hypothetical protein FQY83_14805 [Luteimonas marina]